jgi:hypothetical protein
VTKFLLTPVRNEAAILKSFLDHHAPLFDGIIIADQMSSDGSWQIAESHPKAIPVRNNSATYDEFHRREIMFAEVRRRDPEALVMGLDADEFLLADPREWGDFCGVLRRDEPDSTVEFNWNMLDQGRSEWFVTRQSFCVPKLCGALAPGVFHVPRVPVRPRRHFCGDFPILHLNLLWPQRQRMKVRWYAAMEAVSRDKFSLATHRLYYRTGSGLYPNRQTVPNRFRAAVDSIVASLDLSDDPNWWPKNEILRLFETHPHQLRHAAIWDYEWNAELAKLGLPVHSGPSIQARFSSRWVVRTHGIRNSRLVRMADALLERFLPWLG